MFEGFTVTDIETRGARIHLRHGGRGPALLLLHGNPLTHMSWHKIADRLAQHFSVVCPDLRGYGDSTGPDDGGPRHENYSFRAMAQDQVEVMQALGHESFFVAGHDRGARVAHRMGLDHPDRVRKVAFLDIIPSQWIWTQAPRKWFMTSWHWTFMAQPADFPERMMAAVPARWYMEKKLSKPGIGLANFSPEAFEEYVRCFTWKTIRASCEDYRACATIDLEMDSADLAAGNHLKMPVLSLWGAKGNTGATVKDLLAIWQERAALPVQGGPLPCGHYVPEEAPDQVFDGFMNFFRS